MLGTLYVMCLEQGQAVSEIHCVLQQLNCSELPYKTMALGIVKVVLLTNIDPDLHDRGPWNCQDYITHKYRTRRSKT